MISNMASEPGSRSVATLYQVSIIRPPTIYIQAPNLIVLALGGVLKSTTSDKLWYEHVCISVVILTLQTGFIGMCYAQPRFLIVTLGKVKC